MYVQVDCDLDGRLDHVCYDAAGRRGLILAIQSGPTCGSTWPSVAASVCPPVFDSKLVEWKVSKEVSIVSWGGMEGQQGGDTVG